MSVLNPLKSSIERACAKIGSNEAEITGFSRQRRIVYARFAIARAARQMGYSSTMIGKALKRDHSTIISAWQRADAMYQTDQSFRQLADDIAGGYDVPRVVEE